MRHSEKHKGLQNHSVGDYYPFSIAVDYNITEQRGACRVFNAEKDSPKEGAVLFRFAGSLYSDSFKQAHNAAELFARAASSAEQGRIETQTTQPAAYVDTLQELSDLQRDPLDSCPICGGTGVVEVIDVYNSWQEPCHDHHYDRSFSI